MCTQTLYLRAVWAAVLLSFCSPGVVLLLPVYRSQLSAGGADGEASGVRRRLRVILKSVLFVAGLSVCFIVLGFGAGALGSVIGSRAFMVVMGLIVIVLGLHQTGLIHIKWLFYQKKVELSPSRRSGYLGSFLLGLTFSFGWAPCIGPVLGAILGLSAAGSRPLSGAFLMGIYSLGFLVPFLLLAVFSDLLLTKVNKLNKHPGKIKIAGGVLIILMGILPMTGQLNILRTPFG